MVSARVECPVALTADASAAPDAHRADAAVPILAASGNAVEADVAVAFTLTVTYLETDNIGGGFMILYVDGTPYFLHYRERAPPAAHFDMRRDAKGEVLDQLSSVGRRVGHDRWHVAGAAAFRGIALGHGARVGDCARGDGLVVGEQLRQRRDDSLEVFAAKSNFATSFGALMQGEIFKQRDLAAALSRIAQTRERDFYEDTTIDLIVASQARPLSSMTPTILLKNGKVAMVIGTPAARVFSPPYFRVITEICDFGTTLHDALAALRFHHPLLPDDTIFSESFMPISVTLARQLERRGYILSDQDFDGDLQIIRIEGRTLEAAADTRDRGVARAIAH